MRRLIIASIHAPNTGYACIYMHKTQVADNQCLFFIYRYKALTNCINIQKLLYKYTIADKATGALILGQNSKCLIIN